MQGVRSITSTNLYAEDKEHFLLAYDAPMTFQIHFCLTIKYSRRVVMPLVNHFRLFASPPVCLSFACRHLACLVFCLSRLAFKHKTSNKLRTTQGLNRLYRPIGIRQLGLHNNEKGMAETNLPSPFGISATRQV